MYLEQIIDGPILHFTTDKWQKVTMVVSSVLLDGGEEIKQVKDYEIAAGVIKLVGEGRIESRGDLDKMRYSEIRLPQ